MRFARCILLASWLVPGAALAQSGYVSPDGKARYPGVTIFCPSGTGVAPCSFGGGGGGGGAVSINLGGSAVGLANRFPVSDPALDALITGGALSVGLSGASTVSLGAGAQAIGTVGLAAGSVGSVTAAGTGGAIAQAVQGIAGAVPVAVSGAFYPATQPVSATALPLPAGAATSAGQTAAFAPVAPGAATATTSSIVGCVANTTLPPFTAGQQGAVPCDTSGRLYVVTVPSATNVPGYLQAVTSGGASTASAVNAAASCMATGVKASTGMVFGYSVSNTNGAGVWLRLFAGGSAPVCGAGTPAMRIFVPAGGTVGLSTDLGWVFAGGIGFDVTSGNGGDTDATTVTTSSTVLVNIDYK